MNNENKTYLIRDAEAEELMLQEKRPSASKVLYEDTEKRDRRAKHFRLKNGNFMAVLYDRPVHKLDPETGKYVEIARDMKENEKDYETQMEGFKARFPKEEGEFITVEKEEKAVSWRFVPKQKSRGRKSMATFLKKEKKEAWDLEEVPSVRYEKADGDTDFQYDISEDGVKESIVLKKCPETKEFVFEMKLQGLKAELSEDKKAVFLCSEDGSEEMRIPPAFMVDEKGAYSEDIHYELEEKEGNLFLKLILDTDWISEPERQYPVVIDPRVEVSRHGTDRLRLVEVRSNGSVVSATSSSNSRRIGVDSNGVIHRLYVDIDLPDLVEGYKITKAGLAFHQKGNATYNSLWGEYLIAPVADPNGKALDSASFTWSNVQGLSIGSTIDTFYGYSRPASEAIEVDMTNLVADWYEEKKSSLEKRCIVIKKRDESICCYDCKYPDTYVDIYSLYADYNYRPKLYIEYVNADAYADNQKFHTFENGRAGTGSVNLFTGKMSYAHGDIALEGVRLPLAVSHLYRHDYIKRDVGGNVLPSSYGYGWKLSAKQTLEVVNKHGIMAVYTDAQGKRHYFLYDTNDVLDGEIRDSSGLGLIFKEESNEICGEVTAYSLADEKGNKMAFNSNGNLVQLIDANGYSSCLSYYGDKLIRVTDGNLHSAYFEYNSQNKLSRMQDSDGRSTYFDYDAAGDLVTIAYPANSRPYGSDGILETRFVYDNDHRLVKVIDQTGVACTITYDGKGRVSKLTPSGSICVSDNQVTHATTEIFDDSISFEYRAQSTAIVSNRTGVKTVYRFDANGRELSSYQDMTGALDSTKIRESTFAEISGYNSIVDSSGLAKTGKYRSLSVSLGNDSNDELNLIRNGFFTELDSASKPSGWISVGGGQVSSQNYISGKKSWCFASSQYNKYVTQTVNLCNCKLNGNVLVASAWAKATGNVSAESENSTAQFCLALSVTYEDGKTEKYVEHYDTGYTGWQYVAIPFVLNRQYCPVQVSLKLDYTANTGTCYFTNVRLVAVDGIATTNTYRTDDSPVTSINVFGECKDIKLMTKKEDNVLTTFDYIDDNSDVVRTTVVDSDNHAFITDYKYDSKHNLIKTQDYRGLVIEYTYNKFGKELTRKTYHKDTPNAYMFSELTYQEDHFMQSESDPRYSLNGEKLKTTYEHDTSRNLLLKQTAVNGQEYNYTYDSQSDDLKKLSSTTDNKTNENQFYYTRGYMTKVEHNGFNFGFAFDELGRSKAITVGDGAVSTTLLSMQYEKSGVNDIVETTYATGEKNKVVTDLFGNPTTSTYTDKNGAVRTISNATYDAVGKVKQLVDNERGICYNYTYDDKGRMTQMVETNAITGSVLTTNTFVYDESERMSSKTYGVVGQTYRPVYETNGSGYVYPDNEAIGITLEGKFTDKVTKDGLRRAQRRTFVVGSHTLFEETYGYLSTPNNGKTIETEMVSSVSSHVYGAGANAETLSYTYDKAGNLETVSRGGTLLHKYYYDGLNRLKREDNHTAGKTYVWNYDVGGNILFKKEYALCTDVNLGTCLDTKEYTYKTEGWRDRLDTYDGQTCVYDAMGNPVTYLGNTLTWTKVRRLASFGSNTFAYGANGIRYRKNNIEYTLDGNQILRESDGVKTLTYYHGGSGIVGFNYNGTDYYFRKNLQGDVMEIYTSAGAKVAAYAYDAWGKVLEVQNYNADNIGSINPIRYRGYYYDVETNLYYLNSRYYDPETGRFLNADTTDILENAKYDINGLNLYAYCDNNPVAGRDEEGDASFWKKLAIATVAVVGIAVVAATVAAATAATGGAAGAALCAVCSTFAGAAKGAVIGAVVGAVQGAATGALQGAVEGYQETGTFEGTLRGMSKGAMKGAVQGAADGLISGMVSGAFAGAMNPSFCFVAGTTVLTTLGKKAIESIQIGDKIPCVDHITGEAAEKRVLSTSVHKVNRLIELEIGDETLQCTETHPFQVKGKGWVNASELMPNDEVYTKDWGTVSVRSVNLMELDEPVEVFNFEVEDCHTYFIGELYVLVHNASCHQSKEWRTKRANYWKEQAQLGGNDTWYDIMDKNNYRRMMKGKAPIGYDGKSVVLHHVEGIAKNIDNFVEIGADAHRAFHKLFGYKGFIDVFVL